MPSQCHVIVDAVAAAMLLCCYGRDEATPALPRLYGDGDGRENGAVAHVLIVHVHPEGFGICTEQSGESVT